MSEYVVAPEEIDPVSSPELAERLRVSGDRDIVLDCGEVRFVDSSGLAVLFEAHVRLAEDGRRLILRNPPPQLIRLLKIARLDDTFVLEI